MDNHVCGFSEISAFTFVSVLSLQVVFVNEQSGEYQFYELAFKAVRPGVISTVDLITPVRQSIQHTIKLSNPLSSNVTFNATCHHPEILMPSQLAVLAQSEVSCHGYRFEFFIICFSM